MCVSIQKGGMERGLRRRAPIDLASESAWRAHRKYLAVIDAGSSGSRLHIYSWREADWERAERKGKGLPLDVLPSVEKGTWEGSELPWQVKIEPGLSSFAGRENELRAYLEKMFAHIIEVVPAYAIPSTPVHILATAGMRMLPIDTQQAILAETCRVLREHPFSTASTSSDGLCGGQVRIITGEEEGLFGWTAINYLMDGFSNSTTFGFLDMGGASTQIAFEPDEHVSQEPGAGAAQVNHGMFDVTIRRLDATEVQHHVFVTTFLGFGTNAARERYVNKLAADTTSHELSDPCLPKGLRLAYDKHEAVGTGSFSECLVQQSPLLDREAECFKPPCPFHGVHVPTIDFASNQFIGVSEYWYSAHDVFDLGGAYDYTAFQRAAQDFCASNWGELETKHAQHEYRKQVTLSRLQMQCFKAAWVTTVLHEGLRLPRLGNPWAAAGMDHAANVPAAVTEKNLFQSINDVHGLGVSWTLGKVLLEASGALSLEEPIQNARYTIVGSSHALLLALSVFGIVMLLMFVRMWRKRRAAAWAPVPIDDPGAPSSTVLYVDDAEQSKDPVAIPARSQAWWPTRFAARIFALASNQRNAAPVPPPVRMPPVRVVPERLQSESGKELARDGFPLVPAEWASMLRAESTSPTSVVPARRPSLREVSPRGRSPLSMSRPPSTSPTPGSGRRDPLTVDTSLRRNIAIPETPTALASGNMFSSRPPSRGPSPMLFDSRRPSASSMSLAAPSTQLHLTSSIAPEFRGRLSPASPRRD